ncbi:MAG: haloacid dehalogenase-like hydrolase [Sphingomonadaceae bacterium]|nr:haloacid dehalogenase-like hydrolase [Sphingomonadaceae bacterium]
MMRIAVYDMDLTVTAWPTYTRWLVFWARRRAPWRLALLPMAGVAAVGYRLGLLPRGRVKEIAQALLMGPAARAEVAAAATAFAATVPLRPGALAQLAADRKAGLEPVLATASHAFYAGAIAARVGIGTVVATRSVWAGDRLLPAIDGENCYGPAKAAMIATALPEAAIVRAYSDHVSDAWLLAAASEAVAVNPSRALSRLAATRGWRIVDWR